jgi:hypothetical protein
MSDTEACCACNDSGIHCAFCDYCDDEEYESNSETDVSTSPLSLFLVVYPSEGGVLRNLREQPGTILMKVGVTDSSNIASVAQRELGWQTHAFITGDYQRFVARDDGWDTNHSEEWPDELCIVGRKLKTKSRGWVHL